MERWVIASGKGGTGKTTLATGMARVLMSYGSAQYVDCDVEEPNGRLYLRPVIREQMDVTVPVPVVDNDVCTRCGACGRFCRYGAVACLLTQTMVFPEMCHGCGGCLLVCPHGAMTEGSRVAGQVSTGDAGALHFVEGRLNIGEAMSPPVVRAALRAVRDTAYIVVDAPPGASCPVVAAITGADKLVLVAEPTAFGLNDLSIIVELAQQTGVPAGVVINRCDMGDDRVDRYCQAHGVPVWGRLPFDRVLAERTAHGGWDVSEDAEWMRRIADIVAAVHGVQRHA